MCALVGEHGGREGDVDLGPLFFFGPSLSRHAYGQEEKMRSGWCGKAKRDREPKKKRGLGS